MVWRLAQGSRATAEKRSTARHDIVRVGRESSRVARGAFTARGAAAIAEKASAGACLRNAVSLFGPRSELRCAVSTQSPPPLRLPAQGSSARDSS